MKFHLRARIKRWRWERQHPHLTRTEALALYCIKTWMRANPSDPDVLAFRDSLDALETRTQP